MEYTYDTYAYNTDSRLPTRVDSCTRFEDALKQRNSLADYYAFTVAGSNTRPALSYVLDTDDKWESWRIGLERASAWKPGKVFVDDVVESMFDVHTKHPSDTKHPLDVAVECGLKLSPESYQDLKKEMDTEVTSAEFSNPEHSPGNHSAQHERKIGLNPAAAMPYGSEQSNGVTHIPLENSKRCVLGLTPIDPPHYQNFLEIAAPDLDEEFERVIFVQFQWLETMCRIERYRNNPDAFIAALELQVRKYLDRNGKKDDDLQELQKGLWYYKFMVAFIKNGKRPILVKDVEAILAR